MTQPNPTHSDLAHDWQPTGMTVDTFPSFEEERCVACGAVAWGGSRTGELIPETCHGNPEAFREWNREAVSAHNKRAAEFHRTHRLVVKEVRDNMTIWGYEVAADG